MTPSSLLLACAILLCFTTDEISGSGVLTIRLTGFQNPYGRTYDGACCDPTPNDHGLTCYDQCDYVMRLIVNGLGRANDHVFLFHRPLSYDSNNIVFQNGDSNLVLTVLFDEWPEDDRVKMNAFFYDYDDFDHTTTLVDWFETDLRHSSNASVRAVENWELFQQQTVVGNRQADKTTLTFEWAASRHKKGDYATIDDRKSTLNPETEFIQMKHPTTLAQTDDPFLGYDSNVLNDSYLELETTMSDQLKSTMKSISTELNKQDARENFSPTATHNPGKFNKAQDGSIPKRESLANLKRNILHNLKAASELNSPPKAELFKGALAHSSTAGEEPPQRQPVVPIEHANDYDQGSDEYVSQPPVSSASLDLLLNNENVDVDVDVDEENGFYKPPFYDYRRRFGRPRSWFNHFSSRPSPFKPKHLTKDGKKFGNMKRAETKLAETKLTERNYLMNKVDKTNRKNYENDYREVNFPRRAINKLTQTTKVLLDENAHKQQKLVEKGNVVKIGGKNLRRTGKRGSSNNPNYQKHELKVNLTGADQVHFVDGSNARESERESVDKTVYYSAATTGRAGAKDPNNAASGMGKTSSTVTPPLYTESHASHASETVRSVAKLPLTHSRDYTKYSFPDLDNQSPHMSTRHDPLQPDKESLPTVDSSMKNLDLNEKENSILLQSTHYSPLSPPDTPVESSTAISLPEQSHESQRSSSHVDGTNGSYRDFKQAPLKSYTTSDDTHRHHEHERKNVPEIEHFTVASYRTKERASHLKTQVASRTQNNNSLSQTTERPKLSHLQTHKPIAGVILNPYQTPVNQNSRAQVTETVSRDPTRTPINAAASADRVDHRSWKRTNLIAPKKRRLPEHRPPGILVRNMSARTNAGFREGPRSTQLPVWDNHRKVTLANLSNTEPQPSGEKHTHVDAISPEINVFHNSRQSVILTSKDAETTNASFVFDKTVADDTHSSYRSTERTKLNRVNHLTPLAETPANITDLTEHVPKNKNKFHSPGHRYTTTSETTSRKQESAEVEATRRNNHVKGNHLNVNHLDSTERKDEKLSKKIDFSRHDTIEAKVAKYQVSLTPMPVLQETESSRTKSYDQSDDRRETGPRSQLDKTAQDPAPSQKVIKITQESASPISGKLQRHSIKSLTAIKHQTHSPVEWYVTPREVLLRAAINSMRDVKMLTGKKQPETIENKQNGELTKGQISEKSTSKNYTTHLDTKLKTTKSLTISQTANDYSLVTDTTDTSNTLPASKTTRHIPVDSQDKREATRNTINSPKLSPGASHGYRSTSTSPPHSLSKSINKSNKLVNTGHSRKPLDKSLNEDMASIRKSNHPTTSKISVHLDNDSNNGDRNLQFTVPSTKQQDFRDRASTSGPVTSISDKTDDLELVINEQQPRTVSIDKKGIRKEKEHLLDKSFSEGDQTDKPRDTLKPLVKDLIPTKVSVVATKPITVTTKPDPVTAKLSATITTKPDPVTTKPDPVTAKLSATITTKPDHVATKPSATITTKPSATITTKPSATITTKPSATITTKPSATITTKPSTTITTKPSATITTKPDPISTKPSGTITTKPSATITTKPSTTITTKPSTTITTKPSATITTKPSATITTKPDPVATTKRDRVATTPNIIAPKSNIFATTPRLVSTKGNTSQTLTGPLQRAHSEMQLASAKPDRAHSFNSNRELHGVTPSLRPYAESVTERNKPVAYSSLPTSNSNLLDANHTPIIVLSKSQTEDIQHSSFNLASDENMKDRTDNLIRVLSEEDHQSNRDDVLHDDDRLSFSKKNTLAGDNVHAGISEKSSFNHANKNPALSVYHAKPAGKVVSPLVEKYDSLEQPYPDPQQGRSRAHGHLDRSRVLSYSNNGDNTDEIAGGKIDDKSNGKTQVNDDRKTDRRVDEKAYSQYGGKADKKGDDKTQDQGEGKIDKRTDLKTDRKGDENAIGKGDEKEGKQPNNDNLVNRSNQVSYLQNNVQQKQKSPTPFYKENILTKSTKLTENTTNRQSLNHFKSPHDGNVLTNTNQRTNTKPTMKPLPGNDVANVAAGTYIQTTSTYLKEMNANEYVLDNTAQRIHMEKSNKEPHLINGKQKIFKQESPIQESETMRTTTGMSRVSDFIKDKTKEPVNHFDSKTSFSETKTASKVVNHMILSRTKYPNKSSNLQTGDENQQDSLEKVLGVTDKLHEKSTHGVDLNSSPDKITSVRYTKIVVSDTDSIQSHKTERHLVSTTTAATKKTYTTSTTEQPPSTQDRTAPGPSERYRPKPTHKLQENKIIAIEHDPSKKFTSLDNLKTSSRLGSDMRKTTGQIKIAISKNINFQETSKSPSTAILYKNYVNKIVATATEPPNKVITVTMLQRMNSTTQVLDVVHESVSPPRLKPTNIPAPTSKPKNKQIGKTTVIGLSNFTEKPAHYIHNKSDPFEMMDLFMARQNLMGAILKIKQAVDFASVKNTTVTSSPEYEYTNSRLTPSGTTLVGATTNKRTSQSPVSLPRRYPLVDSIRRGLDGSTAANTRAMFTNTTTQPSIGEKKKLYNTTTAKATTTTAKATTTTAKVTTTTTKATTTTAKATTTTAKATTTTAKATTAAKATITTAKATTTTSKATTTTAKATTTTVKTTATTKAKATTAAKTTKTTAKTTTTSKTTAATTAKTTTATAKATTKAKATTTTVKTTATTKAKATTTTAKTTTTTKRTTASPYFSKSTGEPSISLVSNTTKSIPTISSERTSAVKAMHLMNATKSKSLESLKGKINTYSGNSRTTVPSTQLKITSKSRNHEVKRPLIMVPNFDRDDTKIVYSVDKRRSDEAFMFKTESPPNLVPYHSMNTLPEQGFVLHTLSPNVAIGKPIIQPPHRLPSHKQSRGDAAARRQLIYREMNLDKFRSYVKAIRNHPTVNVPFQGLYTSSPMEKSVLGSEETVAELPDPVRSVGSFYSSMSNVGTVFTSYWPTVLGVSIGSVFLVTALVTSILCRQRRLLIQRTRWRDSPQHVNEPPDTSEYTSSSEASLTSDLTRSSINLM